MKARRLKQLRIKRVDLVPRGANQEAHVLLFKADEMSDEQKALWSTAEVNNLPDSSFAVIEPGGKKDSEGKTTPRSLRHLPYKGPDGKVDLPHLRNALARLPQSDLSTEMKDKARTKLEAAAREAGVGDYGKDKQKAAPAAKEKHMPEDLEKLQKDLDAAMKLAQEESDKRAAVEKSLKDQGETIETLKKRLDESEAEIKKAQDAAKLAEFKKAVDEFEHLPIKADVFAPVLKACNEALTPEQYTELTRVLKAADAAGAKYFVEEGAPGEGRQSSASEQLTTKAEELMKADSKLSLGEATVKAARQNPKLAERARRESMVTASAEEN